MNDHDFQPDAELDALLDEALSPDRVDGGVPADLEARILAALPLHTLKAPAQTQPAVAGPAVIARIGFFSSQAVRRVAAAILVVTGIGIAIIGMGALRNASLEEDKIKQALAAKEASQQLAMARLTSDIEQAPVTLNAARDLHNSTFATTAMTAMTDSSLDRSIDTLKWRTDREALTAAVDSWSNVAQSLEAELDALDSDGYKG